MSAVEILEQIRRLPAEEQRELAERVSAEFGPASGEPSPEQLDEMERRERLSLNPASGIPWEQVKAKLHDRIRP